MSDERALRPRSDGVVTIQPPTDEDTAVFVAARDAEWRRWMGPGDDDPRPTAAIVVGGMLVGWVDNDHDRDWLEAGEVNVGYAVFAPFRRRGYASRAVELLLGYLAECTDTRTATLLIDPQNVASLAVARRTGFVEVAFERSGRYFKRPLHSATSRRVL